MQHGVEGYYGFIDNELYKKFVKLVSRSVITSDNIIYWLHQQDSGEFLTIEPLRTGTVWLLHEGIPYEWEGTDFYRFNAYDKTHKGGMNVEVNKSDVVGRDLKDADFIRIEGEWLEQEDIYSSRIFKATKVEIIEPIEGFEEKIV